MKVFLTLLFLNPCGTVASALCSISWGPALHCGMLWIQHHCLLWFIPQRASSPCPQERHYSCSLAASKCALRLNLHWVIPAFHHWNQRRALPLGPRICPSPADQTQSWISLTIFSERSPNVDLLETSAGSASPGSEAGCSSVLFCWCKPQVIYSKAVIFI